LEVGSQAEAKVKVKVVLWLVSALLDHRRSATKVEVKVGLVIKGLVSNKFHF
jgi:hypothetical protein